jgi:UDP-N-acetylmuramoyl-L-alanyl-D-glutamate--2,6-diaminopimelate ligase
MKLGALLGEAEGVELGQHAGLDISSLAYDSRRVQPGGLFFAIQGEKQDGHAFVPQALDRGAVAIVSEQPRPAGLQAAWVRVPCIRRALAHAAREFYGHPDSKLRLVGITGTNGKTTTAFLLESILRAAGLRTALFGTIEYRMGERTVPATNTTPESLDLFAYLAEFLERGGDAAVMEVSSHALAQERVWGMRFAGAVFTNLTRDHLDYHGDMENYFAAKRRLFEGLGTPTPEVGVINRDDPWGVRLLEIRLPRRVTYGLDPAADVTVKHFSSTQEGICAGIRTPSGEVTVQSPLVGRANLLNILAATATASALGIAAKAIEEGVAALKSVPGRLERVDQGQPFLVLVDYAHTDDALRNVLTAVRGLARGRVITVFGCGGDRDRTKRPLMGEVAGTLSDLAVLTSDNPRSEDPLRIINDVLVGLQKTGKPYLAEVDRETAIRKALAAARAGDAVLIAGKGHESYQILRHETIPFDDREVARKVLKEMGYGKEEGETGSRKSE